ncbi:RNA-directed DNA polymerase, eukaryota, reverse transcriptase zinc-binding domain protein, partial [Tanacetum coccineum]
MFFPREETAKRCNNILRFRNNNQGESLSEAWTRFMDLLQIFPHHDIDLLLQVQIFYDHVNPAIRRAIDQLAGVVPTTLNIAWKILSKLLLIIHPRVLTKREAINDRMTRALPSDTIKNPKLNVNPTSSVSSARSYPTEDPQSSSRPFNLVNAIKTCFKPTNYFKKDQLQVKTLKVNKIGTPKSKEPEKALEDEFKDLHIKLSVLEVLAHAPMYNAILDKYVEILELGKNGSAFIRGRMQKKMKDSGLFTLPCGLGDSKPFDTLADLRSCVNLILLYLFKKLKIRLLEETKNVLRLADGTKSYPVGIVRNVEVHIGKLKLLEDFYVIDMEKDPTCPLLVVRGFLATASVVIDCKKAKITVGEGITRSICGVKEIDLGDLDNSTNNVLIPLDSWTSGLLVYRLPLSVEYAVSNPTEYGVSNPTEYGVSSSLSNTTYSSQQINMAYPLPLDTTYRSSGTETKIIDFRAIFFYLPSEQILLIVYPLFQKHFKLLSLDELRSSYFNLLSDKEYSREVEEEAMAETMEQYMSKTRTDYGSGIARPKIDNKDQFELKGQFLKELRENIFSGSDNEDANEHIEKVLKIVDLFHVHCDNRGLT